MNKKEIIKTIANNTGFKQIDIATVIDSLKDTIVSTVQNGEDVKITDFLTFSIKDIPERSGIIQLGENKGEKWVKPAHKEVKVKLAKSIKNCLAD